MATPNVSNNIWNIVVPVMVVILIVFIIGISFWFWRDIGEGSGSYTSLTEINQNITPEGTIYHLSEKDFEEFPSLALVIRDNSQKPAEFEGRKYYHVSLSEEERIKFIRNYPGGSVGPVVDKGGSYFEYNGKFYSFSPPPIK